MELKDSLFVNIANVFHEDCLASKVAETYTRKDFSFHYITRGKGYLLIGDNEPVLLKKGQCFLIAPNVKYKYYPDSANPWSYYFIDFSTNNINYLLEGTNLTLDKPFCSIKGGAELHSIFNSLYNLHNNKSNSDLGEIAYLFLIFDQLKMNIKSNKNSSRYKALRYLAKYIVSNYRSELTLRKISFATGYSEGHIRNVFRNEIKMSPVSFITQYRIANACILLVDGQYSIKEIAERVGIKDQLYFSRVFKKIKGMSPKMYALNKPNEDPFEFFNKLNLNV